MCLRLADSHCRSRYACAYGQANSKENEQEEVHFDSQDLDRQVIEDAQWAIGKEVDIVVPAGRLGVNLLDRTPHKGVAIAQIMALPTGEPSPLQDKVPEGAQLVKFDQHDCTEWDVKKVSLLCKAGCAVLCCAQSLSRCRLLRRSRSLPTGGESSGSVWYPALRGRRRQARLLRGSHCWRS